jgi:hypothetical protein
MEWLVDKRESTMGLADGVSDEYTLLLSLSRRKEPAAPVR